MAERYDDVERLFDAVANMPAALDIERTWAAATEVERRILLDEFLECVTVLPDYLDVKVHGAPPVDFRYQEVGLKESEFVRVGGGKRNNALRSFDASPAWGSTQIRGRIGENHVREVGTTDLWLPAA